MSARRTLERPIQMSHMRQRMVGFGLIELMIAMVLGLIVMGAAFAVFISNQNTFRANEGLNRIQENARIAFELMSRDIRAAGGSACSNVSVVETADAQSLLFRDSPVTGTANTLTVVSADDAAYRVVGSTNTEVTLDSTQIADARDAFSNGDVMLLCNARKTFVVQATGVSATTVTHTALPAGYDPADDEYAPPAAVVLARFRNVNWFVGPNPRGGSSLWVSRMGGAPEEVADGIQDVGFTYLRAGGTDYGPPPAVWNDVVAVRITMTLTGQDIDGQALTRTASNVVSMRSRTL
jgi:type IV pilus assembly protein PilW